MLLRQSTKVPNTSKISALVAMFTAYFKTVAMA